MRCPLAVGVPHAKILPNSQKMGRMTLWFGRKFFLEIKSQKGYPPFIKHGQGKSPKNGSLIRDPTINGRWSIGTLGCRTLECIKIPRFHDFNPVKSCENPLVSSSLCEVLFLRFQPMASRRSWKRGSCWVASRVFVFFWEKVRFYKLTFGGFPWKSRGIQPSKRKTDMVKQVWLHSIGTPRNIWLSS